VAEKGNLEKNLIINTYQISGIIMFIVVLIENIAPAMHISNPFPQVDWYSWGNIAERIALLMIFGDLLLLCLLVFGDKRKLKDTFKKQQPEMRLRTNFVLILLTAMVAAFGLISHEMLFHGLSYPQHSSLVCLR
jgi:hypothetical protein